MTPETLKRALLVLGALLVGWGVFAVFRGSLSDRPVGLEVPAVPVGEVTRIDIEGPDDTLVIALDAAAPGGRWTVNGRPASQTAVEEVFQSLADTAYSTELIAESPASHERLGVDTLGGRHVVFLSGERALLDLWVGNPGRDFESAYVRREGEEATYLFRGRLASLLARRIDAWRDRHIGGVTADSVGMVTVQTPADRYNVQRFGDGWLMDGGVRADTGEVRRFLEELADLRAAGFPTAAQEDSISFERPRRRLTVTGAGGDTLMALVFDSTQSGVWVRHDTGGVVWRLDPWRVNRIVPPESLLAGRGQ